MAENIFGTSPHVHGGGPVGDALRYAEEGVPVLGFTSEEDFLWAAGAKWLRLYCEAVVIICIILLIVIIWTSGLIGSGFIRALLTARHGIMTALLTGLAGVAALDTLEWMNKGADGKEGLSSTNRKIGLAAVGGGVGVFSVVAVTLGLTAK